MRRVAVGAAVAGLWLLTVMYGCSAFDAGSVAGPDGGGDAALGREDAGETGRDGPSAAADGGCSQASIDAGSPYRTAVLANCPVAYFTLDDAAKSIVVRSLVDGAEANKVGEVKLGAPGRVGTSAVFPDTLSDYLSARGLVDLSPGTAFTLEFWAKPILTSDELYYPLTSDEPGQGYYVEMIRNGGGANFQTALFVSPEAGAPRSYVVGALILSPSAEMDAGAPFEPEWTHVAASYSGGVSGQMRLYLNGELRGEETANEGPRRGTAMRIGFRYRGALDEVAVFDKALSPAQVKSHYDASP